MDMAGMLATPIGDLWAYLAGAWSSFLLPSNKLHTTNSCVRSRAQGWAQNPGCFVTPEVNSEWGL